MIGLYIHIPFCNEICSYCDFTKMIAKEDVKKTYVTYLIKELESYHINEEEVDTIYIGGGTPNSLSNELLSNLLEVLKPYLDHSQENTIEINSELLTNEQAKLFHKYNINRVSIGVQTFQPSILGLIRRKHDYSTVLNSIKLLRQNYIDNINIDMMYGLPGQTMSDFRHDLEQIVTLNVSHLSYYSLILEEKTILNYQLKHRQVSLPDDDLVADMALELDHFLKKTRFHQYEISNYAIPGYESKHNLKYWNEEEYVGIGLGAAGFIKNKRYTNHVILNKYYMHPIASEEFLSKEDMKKEYMMLGFRKTEGISFKKYKKKFKSNLLDDFDLNDLLEQGFLEIKKERIYITAEKRLLANIVFERFVD